MKYLFLIIFISFAFSQNAANSKIDSLNTLKDNFLNQKLYIDERIESIEKEIKAIRYEEIKQKVNNGEIPPVMRKINRRGQLWEKPIFIKAINFPSNAKLTIYAKWYENTNYIYAEYNGEFGWLSPAFYDISKFPRTYSSSREFQHKEFKEKKEQEKRDERKRIAAANAEKERKRLEKSRAERKMREKEREKNYALIEAEKNKRYEKIKSLYGERNANAIMNYKIYIGMQKPLVILSLGQPTTENKTTYSFGTRTQMVYSGKIAKYKYVYLENGIVTSFQE